MPASTQLLTASDIKKNSIRVPRGAVQLFPPGTAEGLTIRFGDATPPVLVHGVGWRDGAGPDKKRSGTLLFGKASHSVRQLEARGCQAVVVGRVFTIEVPPPWGTQEYMYTLRVGSDGLPPAAAVSSAGYATAAGSAAGDQRTGRCGGQQLQNHSTPHHGACAVQVNLLSSDEDQDEDDEDDVEEPAAVAAAASGSAMLELEPQSQRGALAHNEAAARSADLGPAARDDGLGAAEAWGGEHDEGHSLLGSDPEEQRRLWRAAQEQQSGRPGKGGQAQPDAEADAATRKLIEEIKAEDAAEDAQDAAARQERDQSQAEESLKAARVLEGDDRSTRSSKRPKCEADDNRPKQGGTVRESGDDRGGGHEGDASAPELSRAARKAEKQATPAVEQKRRAAFAALPLTGGEAPDHREDVTGRQVLLCNSEFSTTAGWAKGVLTGWAGGNCSNCAVCKNANEEHCGKSNREQLWAEWKHHDSEESVDIHLSQERYGIQWIWEENAGQMGSVEENIQADYDRGKWNVPPVACIMIRRLKALAGMWSLGLTLDDPRLTNQNSLANDWPAVIRKHMKMLLQAHEMRVSMQPPVAGCAGGVFLKLSDPRLQDDARSIENIETSGVWNAWDVSCMVTLMVALANQVGSLVDWPAVDGLDGWIGRWRREVEDDMGRLDGGGYYRSTRCCAGCLRVADDSGEPIELAVHPLFENLQMCPACRDNYTSAQNWKLASDRCEENCRCCGYSDPTMPMTPCDMRGCPAGFCHGCLHAQCDRYGTEEFVAIARSVDDTEQPWECFLCRHGHGPFDVNAEALRHFQRPRLEDRRRSFMGPSSIKLEVEVDDGSLSDGSSDEAFENESNEEEDSEDDDQAAVPAAAAAARAPCAARVFSRTTHYQTLNTDRVRPFVLIENVCGMSELDRRTVQETLNLDMTRLDSVRFSFATRKRLYFTNFDCQDERRIPALEDSPTLSNMMTVVSEDQLKKYFAPGVTDSRFVRPSLNVASSATPFDKALCILPHKGEDLLVAQLNDRLRSIYLNPAVAKLTKEELAKIRSKNMMFYQEPGLNYVQLRLLSGAEREQAMGFPKIAGPAGNQILWTHAARSERIRHNQLGESFEVRTIMWRLKPILDTLHQRCEVEGRPLRVLSICDGIAGGLAALLQLGGWTKGITYVAIEKDIDCRRVVRHVCDHHSPQVTLKQLPQCDDAKAGGCCEGSCSCGDLLNLRPHEKEGLDSGVHLLSYVECHAGGSIDLCLSGYPCKGHSSANRENGRRGRTGHDSEQSGDTWWAACYMLNVLCRGPQGMM